MINSRRTFLKYSGVASLGAISPGITLAVQPPNVTGFTLWQLPLTETISQGNSYVFRTNKGKIIVLDGGMPGESGYLRGFIGALGNQVDTWFISHPHVDHVGALNEILREPKGIVIKNVYHSRYSPEYYKDDLVVKDLYSRLETYRQPLLVRPRGLMTEERSDISTGLPINVVDVQPGFTGEIDGVKFKILAIKNEDIRPAYFNDSCMIVRIWDSSRSFVFLGMRASNKVNGYYRVLTFGTSIAIFCKCLIMETMELAENFTLR